MANIALVDLYGVDKLPRTKGLFNVFNAVAGFLATPTTGWIFDVTGNYNLPFLVVGVMATVGGAMALAVFVINRRQRLGQQDSESDVKPTTS